MSKYIDADLLVKKLKVIFHRYPKILARIESVIYDDMPAADVEPVRHGEWVHDGAKFKGGVDWYHCSVCGSKETGVYVKYNYCSICGAKMRGEEDE